MNRAPDGDGARAVRAACRQAAREAAAAVRAQPDCPPALAPFVEFLEREWDTPPPHDGRPVLAQLCDFVPDELVLAAGARPLRLETGCAAAAAYGAALLLPTDVCGAVRALAGAAAGGLWPGPAPDLLVVPAACDGKRKLATLLADFVEVFPLELPLFKRAPQARERWVEQLRELAGRLERLTGQRLRRGRLARAISETNRRSALARRLEAVQAGDPPALDGLSALVVHQAALRAEPGWWSEHAAALLLALEGRAPPSTRPRARLLLTGSPVLWPDLRLPLLVRETGAEIAADETCAGAGRLRQPVVVDEPTRAGLLRACAERTLLPCTCPCFGESEDRPRRLRERIREARIDGVLHHTLRLCQPFDIDAVRLLASLQAEGVPVLSLTGEIGPLAEGGLHTRVEAFVELLEKRATSSGRS